MKIIIAGSRPPKNARHVSALLMAWYGTHKDLVPEAIKESGFEITEVVSGRAQGFDKLGELWAESHRIPVTPYPAAWRNGEGRIDYGAGFARNQVMADYADGLIAIWDGNSHGTADMILRMRKLQKPVHVHRFTD
jgi:hypothetical protein